MLSETIRTILVNNLTFEEYEKVMLELNKLLGDDINE